MPVVTPADLVLADLGLAVDGLLAHDRPLGERVPEPHDEGLRDDRAPGRRSDGERPGRAAAKSDDPAPEVRVRLRLDAEIASQAAETGLLVVADAESVPVVEVHEVRLENDDVISGRPVAVGGSTGVGHDLRRSAQPATHAPSPSRRQRSVVVLDRPLLASDIATLSGRDDLIIAVPIAGPSPDGIPAPALLRLATTAAHRVGATVLAVTVEWRDPDSDAALAAHVAAGLAATLIELPTEQWQALRDDLTAGRPLPADAVDEAGATELLRWRPPRHRRGLVVFFTGLSGAGKSTLARMLSDHLLATGERTVTVLDGDHVRRLLSAGLGFGPAGRDQNVRRIGFVAAEVARHGGVAICAPIAPYEQSRAAARRMVEQVGDFVLVHVATSLADCEARDVKGLYARARAGQLSEFTGISDPYEVPADAELRVETAGRTPSESLTQVLNHLRTGGWLPEPAE